MQTLSIQAQIHATPADAWELFESEAFRDRLAKKTGLTAELLDARQEGSVEVRRFRYVSGTDLPAVAAKALGATRLAYEQINRFDPVASKLEWSIELPGLADRVKVSGVTTITPSGAGSMRDVRGVIEVKIAFIGGQIEKAVVGQFDKSMRQVNDIANEMLAER